MDVFISWSGSESEQVAEALRRYLPLMINATQPWLSSADIEAGARWATDIAGKLQQSKVGIICLTPTNLESIWIHFEAGALAKTLQNTFVCPYLVGVEPADVRGPLAQFQAMRANKEGTQRLVETINSALGEHHLKPEQLAEAFATFWPKLEEKLAALKKEETPARKRSPEDMLEELLELARRQARDTRTEPLTRDILQRDRALYAAREVFPGAHFGFRQGRVGSLLDITTEDGRHAALAVRGDMSLGILMAKLQATKVRLSQTPIKPDEEPAAE